MIIVSVIAKSLLLLVVAQMVIHCCIFIAFYLFAVSVRTGDV